MKTAARQLIEVIMTTDRDQYLELRACSSSMSPRQFAIEHADMIGAYLRAVGVFSDPEECRCIGTEIWDLLRG